MIYIPYITILFQLIGFFILAVILIPIFGVIIFKDKFQFKKVEKFVLTIFSLMIISWPCIIVNNIVYSCRMKKMVQSFISNKDVYVYSPTVYNHTKTSSLILQNQIKDKYHWIQIDNYFNFLVLKEKDTLPKNIKYFQYFKIQDKQIALEIICNNNLQEKVLNE